MTQLNFGNAFHRIAKNTYVILLKDDLGKLTLLADPGESKPWSSPNKKSADYHASQCDGMAATYEDAFSLLLKEYPQFEKELHERIERTVNDITKTIIQRGPDVAKRKF